MTYPGPDLYPGDDTYPDGPALRVEVAWGADPVGDPTGWVWTEITADVRFADRVALSHGRSDEASNSQPATCQFTLNNQSGRYSLGGQSPNWPYVRRNVPVRVQIDPGIGSFVTLFLGYADGWTPSWNDVSGVDAVVKLSASGILRRLEQGKTPVLSPFRRAMLAKPDMVAYWPCEEAKGAVAIASAPDNDNPMRLAGAIETPYPKWEQCSDFPCSLPLPQVNLTTWRGTVPIYPPTGEVQVRFLARFPRDKLSGTQCTFMRVYTTGTLARWDLIYVYDAAANGLFELKAFNNAGAQVLDTGRVAFNLDDSTRWYALQLQQRGSDVFYQFFTIGLGYSGPGSYFGTITGQTVAAAAAVTVAPDGDVDELGLGHITVQNAISDFYGDIDQFNAYDGEVASDRLQRLCAENQVPVTVTGTSSLRMGPQSVDTLMNLLRECELADQGLLYDGVGPGLAYITGGRRVNIDPVMVLDAARGEVAKEIAPVDDDQRHRNKVTAKRTAGGDATWEDVTGPLGTRLTAVYDSTVTVNSYYPDNVIDYASHAVAVGTVEGYRYPSMALALHHDPDLRPTWVQVTPSSRVDVEHIDQVRPQHPPGTVSLLVEGYAQTIDQFLWDVQITCSPYEPWRAGLWAADGADTAPEAVLRVDTDGSTVAKAAAAGAEMLQVTTSGGPKWTTDPGDFPFDVDVEGIRVTVLGANSGGLYRLGSTMLGPKPLYRLGATRLGAPSSISDGVYRLGATRLGTPTLSAGQLFAVSGVTKDLPVGASVRLWHPVGLGL